MAEDYQTRKDIDTLYKLVWDSDSQQLALATKDELKVIIDALGIGRFNYEKFNFAVADNKFWILSNAKYDYEVMRFVKLNMDYTSFAICLQADTDSHNFKFYYNPKAEEVILDEETYNYNDYMLNQYLGATRKSDSNIVLYDIDVGWMSVEYPPSEWETISLETTGCDLKVNKTLRLAQFKCYRENEPFEDTSYKTITTIPSEYKPLSTVILPFLNKNHLGYIKYDTGVFNVSSNPSGTSTVQTSALWHY